MVGDQVLFLFPHHDDETLFCAFNLMREAHINKAIVTAVTVFESHLQQQRGTGILHAQRSNETQWALMELQLLARFTPTPPPHRWEQWDFRDDAPDWPRLNDKLNRIAQAGIFARVYAPAVEQGGHDQHNGLGAAAIAAWGQTEPSTLARLTRYLSYTRTHGKSRGDKPGEVLLTPASKSVRVPFESWMVPRKLRALACYQSQIENPGAGSTGHFMEDLYEWVAE